MFRHFYRKYIQLMRNLNHSVRKQKEQVCVLPRPLAVNMALPTFAAEHHAIAAKLLVTRLCQSSSSAVVQR